MSESTDHMYELDNLNSKEGNARGSYSSAV